MHAKLNADGSIRYPYTLADLQVEHPNTSFPWPFDQDTLDGYDLVEVQPAPIPEVGYWQTVTEGEPQLVDGVWMQTWLVADLPAAEVSLIVDTLRADAYRNESDPLFFKAQRGEATAQEWLDKVDEIRGRYVKPAV